MRSVVFEGGELTLLRGVSPQAMMANMSSIASLLALAPALLRGRAPGSVEPPADLLALGGVGEDLVVVVLGASVVACSSSLLAPLLLVWWWWG